MNYYLTAIEGMPILLDSCGEAIKYFHKKTYKAEFEKQYQKNLPTMDALENGYNASMDKETYISNMAEALVMRAVEKMNSSKRRNQKDSMMMDLNLIMVTYVFPMLLQYGGNSSQPMVDNLLKAWKREFPKTNIQATSFADIEKGFHRKFCYITTAVCESFGKADDCYELNLLRDYRDHYLTQQPDGEAMIREYYDVAPSIVKHINQKADSSEIYRGIWDQYLAPCISMIEENKNQECMELYRDMVYSMSEKYFIQ